MDIVAPAVEEYLGQLAAAQHGDAVLDEMEARAREHHFPIVGRTVGRFLELQARTVDARRVMELGSGFGYSAYWFARAVGADGEVVCTDGSADNANDARTYLTKAGMWHRVRYHVGDALKGLAKERGEFDIVYCDVDKAGYPDCWRAGSERIRLGGLWICDNTLWSGRAATGEPTPNMPGWTEAIREHNELVAKDPRFVSSIIPIRDGVMVALRVA